MSVLVFNWSLLTILSDFFALMVVLDLKNDVKLFRREVLKAKFKYFNGSLE